jgi:death-on-curing protein
VKNWIWVELREILSMHADQIAEHGGLHGVRDQGLLESALSRAQNLCAYDTSTPFQLAAAYAYGIAKNHPFVDGNKRSAFLASASFLAWNGWELNATETDVVIVFQDLASGKINEAELANWFERHCEYGSSNEFE